MSEQPDSEVATPLTGETAAPRTVALFGSFRYGQYYEDILAGVVAAAEVAGSSLIAIQASVGVMPSSCEVGGQDAVTRAAWDHFDGAIVILQAVSKEYVADLRAAGKFLVAIGQDARGTEAAIKIDNVGGVRAAVSHLAEHGHSRIGFLSPNWQVDTPERFAAYRDQLTELGLDPLPLIGADLPRELSMYDQGYLASEHFIAAERDCTAILVGTDLIAMGFMHGVQETGLEIPADLAIIGIDDVDEAAVSVPPLATVAISFERVGEIAFDVARRGGLGEQMSDEYLVPQRFVPRESCGCPSGSGAAEADAGTSPVDAFVRALADAAAEGVLEASVDLANVARVAQHVSAFLNSTVTTAGPAVTRYATVEELATEINDLCELDRSVQSALRAIRSLAKALVDTVGSQDSASTWAISACALELCDAIRSGHLQRRMAEYVELKRMQVSHYFIGSSLLGHDRDELRSLAWLQQTPAKAGALGLWEPAGQTDTLTVQGVYQRKPFAGRSTQQVSKEIVRVESFPPPAMLHDDGGRPRLVIITQVMLEDSDWGLLAVAGGRVLQSALVQETFQQWSILMSASLDQEKANSDLARQADELTAAYQTEMALLDEVRVSEERYALAAEAAHDALWDWDIATGKVFYSSRWKALLGYRDVEIGTSPAEWLGRVHPDDSQLVQEQVSKARSGVEQFIDLEHRLKPSSGEYRWISCSGRSVIEDGRPVRLVGSITDITVRKLLQEQLLQEARFDGLTGLAKSALFKERLSEAFQLSRQRPDYWFAVLFMDLDGFKAVNDSLGHAAGDELLASVARRLRESLRRGDTAARLGGDEFAVILTDVDQVSELPLIVKRIQTLIRAPHQIGDKTATVGAAMGVAVSGGDFASAEEMLHEADTAMYRAKRRSKQAAAALPEAAVRLTID